VTTAIITGEDLAEFRAMGEAMMTDTCRITVANPEAVQGEIDEDTGQYPEASDARLVIYGPGAVHVETGDPIDDDVVQSGICRFQVKADINSNVVETTAGDREWTYLTSQLQLPMEGTGHIPIDAVAECLTSPYDESMPGRLFNIQGTYHKSQAVIRRFRTREVVA
jgi:hypothetical protein